MRRWDDKQGQSLQQKRRRKGPPPAATDANLVASSSLSSTSSSSVPLCAHNSSSEFDAFSKTTAKLDQFRNEQRMIGKGSNGNISPKLMYKECVSMSSTSPCPSIRPGSLAVKEVPLSSSSSCCQSELFDLRPPTSTSSPSFIPPSSPMPSSPQWHSVPQCCSARTVPKSALLMSKCQSFLRGSSSPIASSPSIVKREIEPKPKAAAEHIPNWGNENANSNNVESVMIEEECVFNFEGLFDEFSEREKDPFEDGESRRTSDGPETTVETICPLTLARDDEALHAKFDWPYNSTERCTIRIGHQNERRSPNKVEGAQIGGVTDTWKEGDEQEQLHQSRSAKRTAARPHHRRDRPPPLPLIGPGPLTNSAASVPGLPYLDPFGGYSPSPSTSTTSPSAAVPSNVVYSIRIGGIQLRNMSASSASSQQKDVQLVVSIRVDRREVFRSCPVRLSGNCCVISEEFCMELPRSSMFHSLHLSLFELTEGARIQRCIGRLRLTRHELVAYGNAIQDRWLPIARIRPNEFTENLGAICAELSWNGQHQMLTLSVFDFTIWSLSANSSHVNPLQRHCTDGGRLFLKCRLGFAHSLFGTMQKMRLVERRSVEPVRFDCSQFFNDKTTGHSSSSPRSPDEWIGCRSPCNTPTSAAAAAFTAKEHSSPDNFRQFKFPPPPSPAGHFHQQQQKQKTPRGPMLFGEPHLCIKLYGKPNYCEDTFCGFVHIPLESETMKPREASHGPNWSVFHVHNLNKE